MNIYTVKIESFGYNITLRETSLHTRDKVPISILFKTIRGFRFIDVKVLER